MILNRNDILNKKNKELKYELVDAWGGQVKVSVMSGKAKDMFEASVNDAGKVNIKNIRAKLVAATVVDEEGKLLFTDKDIEELGELSCEDLDKVVVVAQRLNVLTDQDVNKLAKNS